MSSLFHDSGPPATGQKVLLATPAYENPDAAYTFSVQQSREALSAAGIQSAYLLLSGNCHVDDGRNSIVAEFLQTDCTDLVFLDADVSWSPDALVKLCRFNCDFVGGVYPFRREGNGNMPVRLIAGTRAAGGLLEVDGLPAGFMRMRRTVLERLSAVADHHDKRDGGRVPILFERTLDGAERFSGDLAFCRKWRALGESIFAAVDLRLGHTGKVIHHDSLAAFLRRESGTTLAYMVDEIRKGTQDPAVFTEALRAHGDAWSAREDVLMMCALLAREANGPIIEAGSGLSTIVLAAAAPDQTVWCIEHDPRWALQTEALAAEAGISNIAIVTAPIAYRPDMDWSWYDLSEDIDAMPAWFALGLNDGPPQSLGTRMGFYDAFGKRCGTIIADDADDPGYAQAVETWALLNGMTFDRVEGGRAALLRAKPLQEAAE